RSLVLLSELTQGTGYSGARRECNGCGGPMKFEGYRKRQLLSSFGLINYERAYYYCGVCRQGCMPLDEQLELSGRAVTPRLQRVIGYLAGHLSFGVVAQTLEELQQIEVNREVVRQVAEASGEQGLQRAGVQDGDRIVAVADGAEAMEQIFALVAPEATRVRDFCHVAEKIHAVGEVRFGAGSKECQAWTSAQLHKLGESQVSAVLKSI